MANQTYMTPMQPKFNLFTSSVAKGAFTGPTTSTISPISKTPIKQQVIQLKKTEALNKPIIKPKQPRQEELTDEEISQLIDEGYSDEEITQLNEQLKTPAETPKRKTFTELLSQNAPTKALPFISNPLTRGLESTVTGVVGGAEKVAEGLTGLTPGVGNMKVGENLLKVTSGGTSALFGAVMPYATTLFNTALETPGVKVVPETLGKIIDSVAETALTQAPGYSTMTDENKQNLKSTIINSLFIKSGLKDKGIAKKIETGIKEAKPIQTAGKIIKTPGKGLKIAGEALYKTAIKPNVNEAELMLRSKAGLGVKPITRADTALKYGLAGTETGLGVKSLKKADELFRKTIGPAIDKSKAIHNLDDIFKKVEKQIAEGKGGELRKQELMKGLEALKDDYKSIGKKQFTTKDLQIEKSSLDEFTPTKVFKGQEVAQGYNQVKNTLANVIREQVRDDLGVVGIKNAKELYRDYANLTELSKIGIKGLTEGGLKGGFGTFWSTLYDKLATPIKTVGGKVLYKTGDGLEFIGPKGIKKVGDYLKLNKIEAKNGNIIKTTKNGSNLTDTNILPMSSSTGVGRNIIKPKENPINNKGFVKMPIINDIKTSLSKKGLNVDSLLGDEIKKVYSNKILRFVDENYTGLNKKYYLQELIDGIGKSFDNSSIKQIKDYGVSGFIEDIGIDYLR